MLSGGFHNVAIGNRNRGVNQTADAYRDGVTNLQNTATSQSISSSQQYESNMKVAIDEQARAQITGVLQLSAGGVQRGSPMGTEYSAAKGALRRAPVPETHSTDS